ncbi:MAG: T9SS type A sorting domain-containing protein [Bacteroidia bacterium]
MSYILAMVFLFSPFRGELERGFLLNEEQRPINDITPSELQIIERNAHATELEPNAEMTSVVAQSVLEQAQGKRFERWVIIPEQAMQRKSANETAVEQNVLVNVEQVSKKLTLYPNPTNNDVELAYVFDNDGEIVVYDVSGKQLFMVAIEKGTHQKTLPTSNLSSGLYVCIIKDGENIYREKIIIQK